MKASASIKEITAMVQASGLTAQEVADLSACIVQATGAIN